MVADAGIAVVSRGGSSRTEKPEVCRILTDGGFIMYEMRTMEAHELLLAYAKDGSEEAFRELVNRYVDLVFSSAIRRVDGDRQLAEEVTQAVFTDLARKADSLPPNVMLGGWLHRHTGYLASTARRTERRRRNRERQAAEMNALNEPSDAGWKQLAPMLDVAMDELDKADRNALVLRYFERRELRDVGAALGVSDDTAQKRVTRALEKLRNRLHKRGGAALPVAALSLVLGNRCVEAAPAGLGLRIAKTALHAAVLSSGAASSGFILGLLSPNAMKVMFGMAATIVTAWALLAYSIHNRNQPLAPLATQSAPQPRNFGASVNNAAQPSPMGGGRIAAKSPVTLSSNGLHLVFVAADSGTPVPNVQIEYRGWQREKFEGKWLMAYRDGICDIAIPRASITSLELTTRTEGFADTRLRWRRDRGEEIPLSYTSHLTRPAAIGGLVVDEDRHPLSGAKVGIYYVRETVTLILPESHDFGSIEITTDASGHWSLNRIAPEIIRRIYASATHPEHVYATGGGPSPKAEQQLLAGTYPIVMGRGITLRGVVLDPEGAPLRAAKILVGGRGEVHSRETQSAPDGTFEAKGCQPGSTLVTVEAEGFAPATLRVKLSADSEPLRLTTQPGKVLRLRVLSQAGQPVTDADVWLMTLSDSAREGISVQAHFEKTTDVDGRVVWTNAPNTLMEFAVAASGYQLMEHLNVLPDDLEHVVSLSPTRRRAAANLPNPAPENPALLQALQK